MDEEELVENCQEWCRLMSILAGGITLEETKAMVAAYDACQLEHRAELREFAKALASLVVEQFNKKLNHPTSPTE